MRKKASLLCIITFMAFLLLFGVIKVLEKNVFIIGVKLTNSIEIEITNLSVSIPSLLTVSAHNQEFLVCF